MRISYTKRKSLYGYGFIGLWLIGSVMFFIVPLINSLFYSFSDVEINTNETSLEWVGLKNYRYILNTDEHYTDYLIDTLIETLWKTPLILIFSLFIAVILNQKFRGRTLARAIFFLPVIIASGSAYNIISGNIESTGNLGAEQFSTLFSSNLIGELMQFLGIYGMSDEMEKIITGISDNIFSIVWSSGIQILIFLSALQHIPQSAKDVAQIEGAGAWDYFWKVTFPYVSPFIIVNLIFTVIDSFTNPSNTVMNRILDMQNEWEYGRASAMAWIYFAIVIFSGIIIFSVQKLIKSEME